MKKALIGISMLAMACLICGPAFAGDVPHQPVTTCPNGASALTTPYGADATATVAGSIPIFSLLPNLDNPVTSWPTPGNWDFCAAFDTVACSLGALSSFSTDIIAYQSLFFCSTDINGPINTGGSGLPVTGNGIPDGNFELGLLAAIMNNTQNANCAAITDAYKANFNFFKVQITTALANVPLKGDLRPLVPSLAPYLANGLTTILAAFATEGDATTVAALDELINQLGAIGLTPPAGGVAGNTTGFPTILGPSGDADGDTYTNRAEYNYFKSQGSAVTIAAELDPAITPPPNTAKVLIGGAGTGTFQEGDNIELTAVVLNCEAADYQWSKNGSPIASASASSLSFTGATIADSGKYACRINTVEKGDKEIIDSNTVTIKVVPFGSLPVATGLGLALLAGACALGGVGSIRRRK